MKKIDRMIRIRSVMCSLLFIAALNSCSKKSHPSASNGSGMENTTVMKKTYEKRAAKATFPKMISVNDSVARKSVDGRLYYDVMGHRYWKNYKDGKYYLFNKSMYNNSDFKKPS